MAAIKKTEKNASNPATTPENKDANNAGATNAAPETKVADVTGGVQTTNPAGDAASATITTETKTSDNTPATVAAVTETPTDKTEEIKAVLSDINKSIGGTPIASEGSSDSTALVKKSKLHSTDKVPCRSLFHGKLVYTSPLNGSRWLWNEYGAVQYVPLSELETMNNHKPVFLNKPLIVILEPSVVEDFNFGDVYRKVASFNKFGEDLKTKDVEYIREVVRDLVEVGMRDSVIGEARKQRKENSLVDVNIINMLNTELKTDIG